MGEENVFPCANCGESYCEIVMIWKKNEKGEELPYCPKCYRPFCFGKYPDEDDYRVKEQCILDRDLEACSRCNYSEWCYHILENERRRNLKVRVYSLEVDLKELKEKFEKLDKYVSERVF